jgi:hypothetical protein
MTCQTDPLNLWVAESGWPPYWSCPSLTDSTCFIISFFFLSLKENKEKYGLSIPLEFLCKEIIILTRITFPRNKSLLNKIMVILKE